MAEMTDWGPRVSAAVALAVYVVGLVGAFGARAWLHYRQTGDTGLRPIPARHPAGRLGVVLFAGAVLLYGVGLVLVVVAPELKWDTPAMVSWLGLLLAAVGLAAVLAAQTAMGSSWRVGVDPDEVTELVTSGPFALVRNPIFTAMGLTLVGVTLLVPGWITIVALIAFCVGVQLQVRLVEEPALERLHGDAYRKYAARVGRFLPRLAHGLKPSDRRCRAA